MSKARRSWIGMLLLMMVAGLVLGGCSGKTNEPSASSSTPAQSSAPKASPSSSPAEELKPVNLVWYVYGAEPKNAASVIQKANEIIKKEINATLEMKFIAPGDYNAKMQLVMSSGEEYDLAFTASWVNNYFDNVSKGAYLAIDDLLEKYPDVKNMYRKEIWDAIRVNGKVYGVPNNQIMGDQPGVWFKKDLVDKYKIDLAGIKSLNDFTPVFQTIKDGEQGVSAIRYGIPTAFKDYASIVLTDGYAIDTNSWKVYFQPETLVNEYKLMREWNQKGFFPQDVATLKDELSLIKAGKVFSRYSRQKPGGDAEAKANYGFDVVQIPTGPSVISKNAVSSTITAISATSKNPDRALMLKSLVDTNKELFNLLKFGIEGQDYKKVSDIRIEKIPDMYTMGGWVLGNEFNSYVLPGQSDDVWEQTKKLNDASMVDPASGFAFNRVPVENEIAQLTAINTEYATVLQNGLADVDKTMAEMMEKRKAAGHDKVLAEIQKQLDAWRATQQ